MTIASTSSVVGKMLGLLKRNPITAPLAPVQFQRLMLKAFRVRGGDGFERGRDVAAPEGSSAGGG